jgi:uncharacterized membrane protein (DUF106 family)
MNGLTAVLVALNTVANTLGNLLLPIGYLPGGLSATLVAIATGLMMLLIFKYTSNQQAIKRVRANIRANLLAVRLFKDSIAVGLLAQGRVLLGALRLLGLAVVPMLVMLVPMVLLLAQLGVWYQAAPLPVDQETVVTVKFNGSVEESLPPIELVSNQAVEDLSGPVRIVSQREVCWNLVARQPGYHQLQFRVLGEVVEKELTIGNGVMRVSPLRPGWQWSDVLLYPREKPFPPTAAVQSIAIEYPPRSGWASGTDNWVIYWFVVSLLAGFLFRKPLKVNL